MRNLTRENAPGAIEKDEHVPGSHDGCGTDADEQDGKRGNIERARSRPKQAAPRGFLHGAGVPHSPAGGRSMLAVFIFSWLSWRRPMPTLTAGGGCVARIRSAGRRPSPPRSGGCRPPRRRPRNRR